MASTTEALQKPNLTPGPISSALVAQCKSKKQRERDKKELQQLDNLGARLKAARLPRDPYVLYMDEPTARDKDSIEYLKGMQQRNRLRPYHFDRSQPELQYQTMKYRELPNEFLRLRSPREYKSPSQHPSSIPGSKKISMADYTARVKGTKGTPPATPQSADNDIKKDATMNKTMARSAQNVLNASEEETSEPTAGNIEASIPESTPTLAPSAPLPDENNKSYLTSSSSRKHSRDEEDGPQDTPTSKKIYVDFKATQEREIEAKGLSLSHLPVEPIVDVAIPDLTSQDVPSEHISHTLPASRESFACQVTSDVLSARLYAGEVSKRVLTPPSLPPFHPTSLPSSPENLKFSLPQSAVTTPEFSVEPADPVALPKLSAAVTMDSSKALSSQKRKLVRRSASPSSSKIAIPEKTTALDKGFHQKPKSPAPKAIEKASTFGPHRECISGGGFIVKFKLSKKLSRRVTQLIKLKSSPNTTSTNIFIRPGGGSRLPPPPKTPYTSLIKPAVANTPNLSAFSATMANVSSAASTAGGKNAVVSAAATSSKHALSPSRDSVEPYFNFIAPSTRQPPNHAPASKSSANASNAMSAPISTPPNLVPTPATPTSTSRTATSSAGTSETEVPLDLAALQKDFEKHVAVGRKLKREMVDLNASGEESGKMDARKVAGMKGIESLLAFITAFTIAQRYTRSYRKRLESWRTVLRLTDAVRSICQPFQHLYAFSKLLDASMSTKMASYLAQLPDPMDAETTEFKELYQRSNILSEHINAAFSPRSLHATYPETAKIAEDLPRYHFVDPKELVDMGVIFLHEFAQRDRVKWTRELEL